MARFSRSATGVVMTAVAATALLYFLVQHRALRAAPIETPLATPPGITLEQVPGLADELFADADGRSLYVHVDNDGNPTSDCGPDCATDRPPAAAPADVVLVEDWSAPRTDGHAQWTFRGARLYRYAGDSAPGDLKGKAAAWAPASYRPDAVVELRTGIGARDISDAGGSALVDAAGLTLYVYLGGGPAASGKWLPVSAPALGQPSRDLTLVTRDDGITQWAFRGKPLYRFADDTKPLDVYGLHADPDFRVALVRRQFRPAGVDIRRVVPLGEVLTLTDGTVLYQRDRVSTTNEGHDFREDHGSPALGRALGTATCDAACTADWHPLPAQDSAIPSGHWSIALRSDGSKQWAYRGFAVYAYAHDAPGAALGNAIYDLAPVQETPSGSAASPPTSGSRDDGLSVHGVPQRVGGGLSAFFWHAVVP